ncbi:MAG: SrfA family protein [Rhodospirillales bacterium]
MAGALLRSGSLSEFRPLGAVGKPVYSAASQLRATIRRLYGPETADLFAIPKRHEQGDVIDWYAPEPGSVVPWSAATAEERTDAVAALQAARDRLAVQSQTLQADSETAERKVFGKLLAQATRIPGEDHIYLVNGRPVMTFWGFHPLDAARGFDIIGGLGTGQATPPAAAAADALTAPELETIPAVAETAPVADAPRRWWRLWWLLLPLLLLLLFLLLVGLKSCGTPIPYTDWVPSLQTPPTAPALVPPDLKPVLGPDGRPLTSSEGSSIYVDRDGRTVTVDGQGNLVPVGPDGKPLEGLPPGTRPETGTPSPDGKQPTPEDKPTPSDKPTPDKPTNEKEPPPTGTEQPKPGAEKPDAPGAPPQKPDRTAGPQGGGPGTPSPAAGTPLTIPQKAVRDGDTKFLDGAWRSITGLQDKAGNPVDLSYEFHQGQGPVTLRRSVGGQQQTCSGVVNSAMDGGRLVLNQGPVTCPDGTVFEKSKVACSPGADGKAKCQGINETGSTYDVDIIK